MIERSDLSRLRLMDFFQTQSNMLAHLRREDLEALKLKEVVNDVFLPAHSELDEALKPFRKTGLTDPLLALDAERDAAAVGFVAHIRLFLRFPETDKAEASERLMRIVEKYGERFHRLPQREQTGVVVNLLQDLDTPQATADLALLDATPWVEAMRTANNAFEQLYNDRTRLAAAAQTGRTRNARIALQEAFNRVVRTLNALALLEGEEPYGRLAENINREVQQALQTLRTKKKKEEAPAQTPPPGEEE